MYRNVYRRIMIGTGIGSACVAVGYIVAASMAGLEDVELSTRVGSVALTVILGLGMMSGTAWLVQASNRDSIRRDLPPILAATFRANAEVIAEEVAGQIAHRLRQVASETADSAHARTVASFREIITSELVCEQLNAATARIHRLGMITEASGRANVSSIRGR